MNYSYNPAHMFPTKNLDMVALKEIKIIISRSRDYLQEKQNPLGFWCFELETDCTMSAQYIYMMHFMDEIDTELQKKLANYIKSKQQSEGGWDLYHGGKADLNCTVQCYFALKLAGEPESSGILTRAKKVILSAGGAESSNVFTRYFLAFFEQVSWEHVPYSPIEMILLPTWSPFHIHKISYWSRTLMVPLFILYTLKKTAKNPNKINVHEIFLDPSKPITHTSDTTALTWRTIFHWVDQIGKKIDSWMPHFIRKQALKKAEHWMIERLNGEDGLGGIFPPMMHAYLVLDALGYPPDHPLRINAKRSCEKLLVHKNNDITYCQSCVSPVWDTVLSTIALLEYHEAEPSNFVIQHSINQACDWLLSKHVTDQTGDWAYRHKNPQISGGGWSFQFENPHYPDLDDTAMVAWLLHRLTKLNPEQYSNYRINIDLALQFIRGMQSKNGGFAAFDCDNTSHYLNEIPFADHKALLDPPTVDVSARCLMLFCANGLESDRTLINRCLEYILSEQESDGSWFGRWGTNYIYGTWSVLMAFSELFKFGYYPAAQQAQKKAIDWLLACQNSDGGWGEDNGTYYNPPETTHNIFSTSFHTSWALLGLLYANVAPDHPSVQNGIQFLLTNFQADINSWKEPWYNAPGFPRVFYLKYHGYSHYFPFWALSKFSAQTR